MENINQVQVVRYIRPRTHARLASNLSVTNKRNFDELVKVENDNMHGITLVFNMDYEDRSVVARWSICNGDNFNKEVGVDRALHNPHEIEFSLNEVEKAGSLTAALLFALRDLYPSSFKNTYGSYSDHLNIFLRASRED